VGIRGTDFSVFTDANVTRASVRSGGIVLTPLGIGQAGYGSVPVAVGATLARTGFDFTLNDASYPGNDLYDSLKPKLRIGFTGVQCALRRRHDGLVIRGAGMGEAARSSSGRRVTACTASITLDYDMARHGQIESILQQRTPDDNDTLRTHSFSAT
jgi:hypothetical protein